MATANIHDRQSIAAIYPPEAFAVDAAENQKQPANDVLRGVTIGSAPDAAGNFTLDRAARQIGEAAGGDFLAAARPLPAAHARREATPAAPPTPDPTQEYDAFVDRIIAAAPRFGFRAGDAPGPGDPRLRGPRQ
ncbi:MAG: hypothetical protein ACM3JG_17000 [Thiohalocapsa sp.]